MFLHGFLLGLLRYAFISADFLHYNKIGTWDHFFSTLSGLSDALQLSVARCILLAVSLGWGVVYATLNSATCCIIIALGVPHFAVSAVRILFLFPLYGEAPVVTEHYLYKLNRIGFIIDLIFVLWTVQFLVATMLYLQRMNDTRMLERYTKVRYLFKRLVVLAVFWMVIPFPEERMFMVAYILENVHFALVMVTVSALWSNSQKYAYFTQLPVTDTDGEIDMTEDLAAMGERSSDNNNVDGWMRQRLVVNRDNESELELPPRVFHATVVPAPFKWQ